MLNNIFYQLVFISLVISGCRQEDEGVKAHVFYTGVVDSIKVFQFSKGVGGDFMFNPLTGQDKIWTLNYTAPLELDLHTGEWTPLSESYHERLSGGMYGEPIWKDSLTNEVFITNFHEGLIHFPCDGSPISFYQIQSAQSVLNAEDEIVIGTAGGLYTVDKQNKTILKVPDFPMDVWVNDVEVLNEDTLVINNGRMFFPYRLKNPSTMIHFKKDPGVVYNNPFLESLPKTEEARQYRLHYSGNVPFMYSSARIFFQDSTKTVFEIENRPHGHLHHLKTDARYIYLLYDSAFVILNKNVAMQIATAFDIQSYEKNRERFHQAVSKLQHCPLDTFLVRYQQIRKDSMLIISSEFSEKLERYTAGYFTHTGADSHMVAFEEAIHQNRLTQELEKYAIIGVCMKYVKKGDLDKIPFYNNLLNERYPDFEYYSSKSVLECVIQVKHSIDSLQKQNLAPDAYLFKEAKLKERLVYCGWTGDSYYDFSIVTENYRDILSKYPNSRYADNAAFYFISMMWYGDEGDEYSKDMIAACNEFLSTYPTSELQPQVRLLIVRNYHAYYGEPDSMIIMKEKALSELLNISVKEVQDTNLVATIEFYKADILTQLTKQFFELIVSPERTEYKTGEEVKLKVQLRNKTNEVRQIRLYSNAPGWLTLVGPADQTNFMPTGTKVDTNTQLLSIMPNDTLFQEINISREARHWKYTGTGSYEFNQPGKYTIRIRDPGMRINSDHVSVYIY